MKRDLKINYGILDDIIARLHKYQGSLEDMREALRNIDSFVQTNYGESIDAWKDKIKHSELNIKEYETQIKDLLTLFESYVADTTSIISPVARNAMMRVGRNDIYHNLNQLENGISNNLPKAISRTYKSPGWGWFEDPTDEEKADSRYNEGRIESIRADIQSTKSRLDSKMDQLWDLYNSKVIKFENMDDDYKGKADAIKDKYTNFFEGLWDVVSFIGEGAWDLIRGLTVGVYEIVKGVLTLVVDAGIIVLSGAIPDAIEPDILKQAAKDRVDAFTQTLEQIIEDPMSVVENIAQSISDAVEEEGIMYVFGNAASSFVPIVGQAKVVNLAKVAGKKGSDLKQKVSEIVKSNKAFEGVKTRSVEIVNDVKKLGKSLIGEVVGGIRVLANMFDNKVPAMSGVPNSAVNVLNSSKVLNDAKETFSWARVNDVDKKDVSHQPKIKEVTYGEQFIRGKRGRKELAPNVRYITEDDYKYTTDDLGRIVDVEADSLVLNEANRNKGMQRVVGREFRKPDDDGGHLIGSQFHGSGDLDNLVAQNSQINRSGGQWYKMESEWAKALNEIPPKKVSVKINPRFEGDSLRPERFIVLYEIEGAGIFKKVIINQVGG